MRVDERSLVVRSTRELREQQRRRNVAEPEVYREIDDETRRAYERSFAWIERKQP